jgi:uncharacterized membrane protein YqaE (UPF0057 family)
VLYLLAIVLPPLAVLIAGGIIQCLLNIALTACFIVPGIIHALLVVGNYHADRRNRDVIRAVQGRTEKPRSFRLS